MEDDIFVGEESDVDEIHPKILTQNSPAMVVSIISTGMFIIFIIMNMF